MRPLATCLSFLRDRDPWNHHFSLYVQAIPPNGRNYANTKFTRRPFDTRVVAGILILLGGILATPLFSLLREELGRLPWRLPLINYPPSGHGLLLRLVLVLLICPRSFVLGSAKPVSLPSQERHVSRDRIPIAAGAVSLDRPAPVKRIFSLACCYTLLIPASGSRCYT